MDIRGIIKSPSIRNFTKLLSANVVAQVIGLIVYPILTRIYAPEDFGLLNLFLSIGGVLTIISTAEYYYAIVLPKEHKQAVAVLWTGVLCLILTGGVVCLSVFFATPIASLLKTPLLASYYWMMPFYVMAMGGWNLLNYWYIRTTKYSRISHYQISQSILSAGGKIGFGYLGILQGGMIYSVVLAPLVALVVSFITWKPIAILRKRVMNFNVSWQDICKQTKEYKNFPLFVLPRSFVNMLAGQMPVLLLTPFFGSKLVGFYSLALLLGYTPIGTITRAVYQVLYQQTTERVHKSLPIGNIFKRFIIYASIIIVPVFIGLYFILPEITSWIFGKEWYVSGEYIRWMLPWLYVSFLSCSINYLFDVFMKQKWGLFFEVLLALVRVLGLVIGVRMNSFIVAIASYSIGTTLALMIQLLWMLMLVRRYDRSLSGEQLD